MPVSRQNNALSFGSVDDDGTIYGSHRYQIRSLPMQGMDGDNCPFEFNFEPETFKVGDMVSYRVTGSLAGFPFMGTLLEVHSDHVVLTSEPDNPASRMQATRESRPVVEEADIC
jgi:hypothetical protein